MEASDTIIFNQAIRIPPETSNVNQSLIITYTAAVAFNLALAHHCTASRDATCTPKAEKLYWAAFNMLDESTWTVHTALVIKLACINNLSLICFSIGDYQKVRETIQQVAPFIRQTNQVLLDEPKIQDLLMNVMLLRAPLVASAA
jgi:hypothetical protein